MVIFLTESASCFMFASSVLLEISETVSSRFVDTSLFFAISGHPVRICKTWKWGQPRKYKGECGKDPLPS